MSVSSFSSAENRVDEEDKNPENSEVLGRLEQEENRIQQLEGWEESVSSWEYLRKQYQILLDSGEECSAKILEIEQKKNTAEMYALLKNTETTKGWKESEKVYSSALAKIGNFSFSAEIQTDLETRILRDLEITQINLLRKKQEKIEKTSSYQKSLEEWKNLEKEYESLLSTASSKESAAEISGKISEIQGKFFIAQTAVTLKKTKQNSNWQEAEKTYSALFSAVQKNPEISEKEKKTLLGEISEYLEVTDANLFLKNSHSELLDAEQKIFTLGYRKSQKYWKKMQSNYRLLAREARGVEGAKSRHESFLIKEKEMAQNTEISGFHATLENSKESDSWKKSQKVYQSVLQKSQNSKIPNTEKHDIAAKAEEYLEISETNIEVKEELSDAQSKVSNAVENLDWDESGQEHEKIQKKLSSVANSVKIDLLESARKKELEQTMAEISGNIETCTQEEKAEKLESQEFSPEVLAEGNPHFSLVYSYFLAGQYALKNDPENPEISQNLENSEEKLAQNFVPLQSNKTPEISPVQNFPEFPQFPQHSQQKSQSDKEAISSENSQNSLQKNFKTNLQDEASSAPEETVFSQTDIEQQLYEQKQNNVDEQENAAFLVDLNPKNISALNPSDESWRVQNVLNNKNPVEFAHSGYGIKIQSPQSLRKYTAQALLSTLPKESRNFSQQQVEAHLLSVSQTSLSKSQAEKFL